MLLSMRKAFKAYYDYQEELLLQTIRLGHVRIPISNRKRWLGHAPQPPECANTPIQGGAAGLMNMVLPRITRRLPPGASLVAQVHDAAYFEVPAALANDVVALCKEETSRPVVINGRSVVFPTDIKIGERWSDL
jgi:DNA polymerase I-like protein with 3'-5' exonuclease and polymerase domains